MKSDEMMTLPHSWPARKAAISPQRSFRLETALRGFLFLSF